jgi:hypothetical protein
MPCSEPTGHGVRSATLIDSRALAVPAELYAARLMKLTDQKPSEIGGLVILRATAEDADPVDSEKWDPLSDRLLMGHSKHLDAEFQIRSGPSELHEALGGTPQRQDWRLLQDDKAGLQPAESQVRNRLKY